MVGGLDESGISELLEAAAGHPLDARASALVAALHAATGGNPFFIGEVLAHLVETGADLPRGRAMDCARRSSTYRRDCGR